MQVSLGHSFEMTSRLTTRIVFTDTQIRVRGPGPLRNIRPASLPQPPLPEPLAALRSARFDTTYLSAGFRVSRGDRGELRLYVRAE